MKRAKRLTKRQRKALKRGVTYDMDASWGVRLDMAGGVRKWLSRGRVRGANFVSRDTHNRPTFVRV